jgi:SPP1 family predicted phage head-tail adaptor
MTYTLRAGDLDRRIDLASYSLVPDPEGWNVIPTWTTYAANVPARVIRSNGSEYLSMNQVVAEARAVFVIRWRPNVKPTDRITFEGQPWDVQDVRELGRRVGLEIHCRNIT